MSLIGAPTAALSHILSEKRLSEGIASLQEPALDITRHNIDMDTPPALLYDPPVNYGGYHQTSGRNEINLLENNLVSSLRAEGNYIDSNSFQINIINMITHIGAYVWFGAMLGLLIYCIASYLHLKRKLSRTAKYSYEYKGVPVYLAEGLKTPFVLGMKKAFIYLPASLTEQESRQCLAHEYTHICRRDHLIKFFAFCLGCVYWFNPLVWLAFHLMTKDMEMSCDEMTLKGAGIKERKAYSKILLQLSTQNQHFAGCPLAFGENRVTSRIKNILKYKKASFLVLLSCTILISVFAITLLTDPVNSKDETLTVAENISEPDNNPLLDENQFHSEKKSLTDEQAAALDDKQSAAIALASQKLLEEELEAKNLEERKLQQELMEENIKAITAELQVLTELYEKAIEKEEKKAINLEIISLQNRQNSLKAELNALNQELSVISSDSFSYSNTESIQEIQVLYARIIPGKQDNSKNKR